MPELPPDLPAGPDMPEVEPAPWGSAPGQPPAAGHPPYPHAVTGAATAPTGWPRPGPPLAYPAVGGPWPAPPPPTSPVATYALVVGVIAFLLALVPVIGLVAIVLGIVAAVLGVVSAASERSQRGRAVTGAVLGGLAIPLALAISAITLVTLLPWEETSPEQVRSEVADMATLLDRGDGEQDHCVTVVVTDSEGRTADYVATNTCGTSLPSGLFIMDARDAHGTVIASGWGEVDRLAGSGSGARYESYTEFDADVSGAADFTIRDLDVDDALYDEWFEGDTDSGGVITAVIARV